MPCGGQPGTPFLYIPDSGPADHAAAACGPRGTKRSPKLLSSSRISRRQSINAHARGLSKESSGIRQNDKSGRNPGPYENCFQSGFLLLPSFPLVHPGTSDFRTLPCLSAGIASSRCPDPESRTVKSDMEDLNALVCEALQAEAQQLVHPLTQRRRCGPPALCSPLAARSAGRGADPPPRCGARGAAPCTALSSGLRVQRAPRPRDRALLASHVATAAAQPRSPGAHRSTHERRRLDPSPDEPASCLGPRCAPCRPLLRAQGGGACTTPPQRCRLSCVEAGPAAWSCGPTHAY